MPAHILVSVQAVRHCAVSVPVSRKFYFHYVVQQTHHPVNDGRPKTVNETETPRRNDWRSRCARSGAKPKYDQRGAPSGTGSDGMRASCLPHEDQGASGRAGRAHLPALHLHPPKRDCGPSRLHFFIHTSKTLRFVSFRLTHVLLVPNIAPAPGLLMLVLRVLCHRSSIVSLRILSAGPSKTPIRYDTALVLNSGQAMYQAVRPHRSPLCNRQTCTVRYLCVCVLGKVR